MHDAYDLSQLLKLTVQIESIAAYDDYLLVGTKQGHLLTYSVTKKLGEHKLDVQLLSYNKHFSKKPVTQLQAVPDCQLLISLSDSVISVHNIQKVQSQTATTSAAALQRTRGATLFSLNITRADRLSGGVFVVIKMCVVVKRKLQFYWWKHGQFTDMTGIPDITLPDVPLTVNWLQDAICLGYKSEYSLINLASDNVRQELFPTGKAPEPIITDVDKNVFALVKDAQCILINTSGDPTLMYAVKWADYPNNVIGDKPFLIALLPEAIEIKTFEPNQFIQNIKVEKAHLVVRPRPGRLYIASSALVWCLQAVPVPQQIKVLLENKQFELALKLAKDWEWEDEEQQKRSVRSIQKLYAHHLFASKQFQESMQQFLTLDVHPCDVIKLFPDLMPNSTPQPQQTKLTEKELEDGIIALIEYLTEKHRSLINNKQDKGNLLSIIDTTLLKCYLQTNDAMVAPLLRLNMLHFNETERVLKAHNKTSELVILYQTNKMPAQALALLKKLKDVDKTVQYLKHLGPEHLNLILEYSEWVLQENPKEGLNIFIEDTSEVEQLPRPQVVNFLLRTAKELAIPYSEHAIKVWKDTNPILHTTLANLYREKYQMLQAVPESRQDALIIRGKLIEFLEHSDHYTPHTVISLFPKNDLLEERAILLGKQGRHEQALAIYVCLLENVQLAEEYCERVYNNKVVGYEEVYVLLIRILISPPENWLVGLSDNPPVVQKDLETAVQVLRANADKIDPSQALSILPDSVSLTGIRSFLMGTIRNKMQARRRTQILKGLVYSEHLQVQRQRLKSEARPVLVTELDICVICSKRFTNQGVVALIPKGIIHYGCLGDLKQ